MSRHFYLIQVLTLLLFFACKNRVTETSRINQNTALPLAVKPNILIIHVDDLGYHDLSGHGSKIYQTPNIDALERESVSFTNAYANYPRCVPSRYAMITGNYPIQNGAVPDDGFNLGHTPDNKNFIKQLKASGYQTAYFGKWHLGGEKSLETMGFDYHFGAGHAGSPISFLYPFNEQKWGNGKSTKSPIPDVDEVSKKGDYLMDVMTHQVCDYIKNRDASKPFLAMFAFYAVHQPLEAKTKDIERNRQEIAAYDYGDQPEYILEGTGRTKMRQDHPIYAAMVETMDENVGKLMQLLKDLNIEDDTVVIFSSDHGGLSNDGYNQRNLATSNYPLRAGKGWLYDGGIKVPFFVKWKHKLKPRKETTSIIMLMDVFPTIVDMTSHANLNTDGKSFLPVLDEKEKWEDRTVFWHSSRARPRNTGDTKSSAIRQGHYKLIHWYEAGITELYNIVNDPYEQNNLAEALPAMTAKLLDELQNWKATF